MLFIWFFQGDRKFCQKSYSSDDGIFIFPKSPSKGNEAVFLHAEWNLESISLQNFLCRSVNQSGCSIVCRSLSGLSVCQPSVCLPSVCVCLFASMSVCLSLTVRLSVHVVFLCVCLSIGHSVYRSVSRELVSSMVSQVRSRASSDINSVCNTATKLNRPVGFFGVTVIAYVFERL